MARRITGGLEECLNCADCPLDEIVKKNLMFLVASDTVRFKTRLLYWSTALRQHRIGLDEVDDGIWSVFFCNVLLGRIDERKALMTGQLGVTHVPG